MSLKTNLLAILLLTVALMAGCTESQETTLACETSVYDAEDGTRTVTESCASVPNECLHRDATGREWVARCE